MVAFDDNRLARTLFGEFDQNLAMIEKRLGVEEVDGLAKLLRALGEG